MEERNSSMRVLVALSVVILLADELQCRILVFTIYFAVITAWWMSRDIEIVLAEMPISCKRTHGDSSSSVALLLMQSSPLSHVVVQQ